MVEFRYASLPGRVVFGNGSSRRDLPSEVDGSRILLITSKRASELADELVKPLGERVVGRFTDVREHVPQESADEATAATDRARVDCLLTIGGGSVVGTAKAVAVRTHLPIVAVPTTYSGSEMTPTWGVTEAGRKHTARSPDARPRLVIYDPELTVSLPPAITAASGMNALAHCVAAAYLPGTDPISMLVALEAVRSLAAGLTGSVTNPTDLDARGQALYGAYLAGTAFAVSGPATHHRICHILGGAYGLPHAQTHSVVLPYVAALMDSRLGGVAAALGTSNAGDGLRDLAERVGAPTSLAEIGMRADDLKEAIDLVAEQVDLDDPPGLLEAMYEGRWDR